MATFAVSIGRNRRGSSKPARPEFSRSNSPPRQAYGPGIRRRPSWIIGKTFQRTTGFAPPVHDARYRSVWPPTRSTARLCGSSIRAKVGRACRKVDPTRRVLREASFKLLLVISIRISSWELRHLCPWSPLGRTCIPSVRQRAARKSGRHCRSDQWSQVGRRVPSDRSRTCSPPRRP
jgi:hypothetical protein